MNSWQVWLKSLIAAIVGGAATTGSSWLGVAIAQAAGAPVQSLDFKTLGIIMLSGAITSALAYLQKSPVPGYPTPTPITPRDSSGAPLNGAFVTPELLTALGLACAFGFVILTICGCTTLYDPRTGRKVAQFMNDMEVSHYQAGATTWDVQRSSHSTIIRAYGHAGGSVIGAAAAGAIGWRAAATQPLIGAVGGVVPSIVNRPTSTPAPAPAK